MKGEKIKAEDVIKLREKTGAGIMDCKKALLASDNDENEAIKWLRENWEPVKILR